MTYQTLANLFKVLSDPNRIEIIDLLSCGDLCAHDILQHFQFSQPTLSHHMKILTEMQLVFITKTGSKKIYKLNFELLSELQYNLEHIQSDAPSCICKTITKEYES